MAHDPANVTHQNVIREVKERRRQFMEMYNPEDLQKSLEQCQAELYDPIKNARRFPRQRNHIANKVQLHKNNVINAKRKRDLFDKLGDEIIGAASTMGSRRYYVTLSTKRRKLENIVPLPSGVQAARTVLEDVMLCDASSTIIDTAIQVDDVCECGEFMRRMQSMSCLICPNPECQQMRTYIDTSTGSAPYSKNDNQSSSSRRKCLTHYGSFLKGIQYEVMNKAKFDYKYLLDLCRFCYIQGARTDRDINKKIINAAQTYVNKSGKPDYTNTPLLICLLGGGLRKMPPELVNKLMIMLDCLIPVFEKHKHLLDTQLKNKKKTNKPTTRNNMINFEYSTLVNLRMLGYKVYEHLIKTFDLDDNQLRHGWFMRLLYEDLGWEWADGQLADFPDADLDKAYFCAMMLRKERMQVEILEIKSKIRALYEAKCVKGACSCFLHAYEFKEGEATYDAFEHLQAFVEFVATMYDNRPITLELLRELSIDFDGDIVFSAQVNGQCC